MTIVSTSTGAFYERSRANMKDLRTQAETLQAQLSSGQKLTRSSDNPVAASRLRALSRLEALSEIDTTNSDRASSDLSLADSAMSDMADSIIRAKELALQASNSATTADQRSAIGAELAQIHSNLLALSNARDSNGHALFGGETAGDAYGLDASGNAVYLGTPTTSDLPIGEGQTVTRSMTGPEFLNFDDGAGGTTDIMATIKALSDALQGGSATPAAAAQGALADLQTGLDSLTTGQTVIGTRLSWLEVTSERRTNQSELRSTEEADLGSTDLASTVARLQETLTVLEASQASFSKLASLSLFDNIR
jgi:flagellar hook-associated protein 3 FlgL